MLEPLDILASTLDVNSRPAQVEDTVITAPIGLPLDVHADSQSQPDDAPALGPPVPPDTLVAVPQSRGWWRRARVGTTPTPDQNETMHGLAGPPDSTEGLHTNETRPLDLEAIEAIQSGKTPISNADGQAMISSDVPTPSSHQQTPVSSVPDAGTSSKGWSSLIWGGMSQPIPANAPRPASAAAIVPVAAAEIVASSENQPTSPVVAVPEKHILPEPAVKPGWSSYMYSFIHSTSTLPPAALDPRIPPPAPLIEPDPAVEQGPVPTLHPPAISIDPASPRPAVDHNHAVVPATASTGWLAYLASIASQKRLSDTSAPLTKASNSNTPATSEEVMDFCTDPHFPSTSISQPKTKTALQKRPSSPSPMTIRQHRLSITSSRSESKTPIASPKATSILEGKSATSVKIPSSSVIPAVVPGVRPNLVIPTFETTFDRPPRSLPPLASSSTSPADTSKGLAAATTGLAWKALGAVGGYVYGSDEKKVMPEEGTETRGVGADLPRRIGLGTAQDDEGWKDVKRVVVVGVHGWFPAKMLNS